MEEGRKYAYWLLNNNVLDIVQKRKLYEHFSDAYHIYFATQSELLDSGILKQDKAEAFLKDKESYDVDREYEEFLRLPFSFTTLEDQDYPYALRFIDSPPYGLFYLGRLPDINEQCIAMVGSRMPSAYGKKCATELSGMLAEYGFTVVSGMARGIDSFSHRGCLDKKGRTIAVLGCGVDIVYPRENYGLYEEIKENGCILSEFPLHRQPLSIQFPGRNRIISGLSSHVIVVEAKEKSGSLITADFALEQGKELYVIPGRVYDCLSAGCNRLIDQGAGIIYSYDNFVAGLLQMDIKQLKKISLNDERSMVLEKDEAKILELVDYYPKNIENIQLEAGFDYIYTNQLLMKLTCKELIKETYKNTYVRIC